MLVEAILIGVLTVTSYQPIAKQTDDSPTWTSIGDRTTRFGCAVSRDLLASGKIKYGDAIYIEGYGIRIVNDCMHSRHSNSIDLLVFTHEEEHAIGTRHKKVWRIYAEESRTLSIIPAHKHN